MPDANGVPTTFEMDGLLTQEDIDNRFYLMTPCNKCKEWTKQDTREKDKLKDKWGACSNCGSTDYNTKEARSLRSWEATKKK